MRREEATLRAMVESELNSFRCTSCKEMATYIAGWVFTKHASRAYVRAGGRAIRSPMMDPLCAECARKWARDNDLKMPASAVPDAAYDAEKTR